MQQKDLVSVPIFFDYTLYCFTDKVLIPKTSLSSLVILLSDI